MNFLFRDRQNWYWNPFVGSRAKTHKSSILCQKFQSFLFSVTCISLLVHEFEGVLDANDHPLVVGAVIKKSMEREVFYQMGCCQKTLPHLRGCLLVQCNSKGENDCSSRTRCTHFGVSSPTCQIHFYKNTKQFLNAKGHIRQNMLKTKKWQE